MSAAVPASALALLHAKFVYAAPCPAAPGEFFGSFLSRSALSRRAGCLSVPPRTGCLSVRACPLDPIQLSPPALLLCLLACLYAYI